MIETDDPDFRLLRDELFGPIVTAYVYDEKRWDDTLRPRRRDRAVRAHGRGVRDATARAIEEAHDALRYAAGNFYVNDKPTGAVVGQQPFGGARATGRTTRQARCGTSSAGCRPRTVKETFVPPTDYRYPFLAPDSYDTQ